MLEIQFFAYLIELHCIFRQVYCQHGDYSLVLNHVIDLIRLHL